MTAAEAWAVFVFGNAAWITALDLWFHFTRRPTMTHVMHDWVFVRGYAQFIIPAAVALVVWFIVHEIQYHPHG